MITDTFNTVIFLLSIILKGFTIGSIVLCIWYTFQEDEIFESFGYWVDDHVKNEKWRQPIYACNVCMTPWYGSVVYWLLAVFVFNGNIIEWILSVLCAMAFNIVLNKLEPKECEPIEKQINYISTEDHEGIDS